MDRGKLLILSGFSGVGKGTIVSALLNKYPEYKLSVSYTTRNPRKGEVDGIHYHFRTQDEFDEKIECDAFLEYARYVNNSYGTPKKFVEDNLSLGNHVILEIETQGAIQVKEKIPDAMMVFLLPPSAEELRKRLENRNSESRETIEERLKKAVQETENMKYYEYFVINDKVENCVDNLNRILNNDSPVLASPEEVNKIKNDIKKFLKGE